MTGSAPVACGPDDRACVRACFVTLGCAKNEVDSADMARRLADAGYGICDDCDVADLIIVNTCSFIQSAVEEGIDAILDVIDAVAGTDGTTPIIVTGCMPSRYGADLEAELDEVHAFLPCAEEERIVEVADACLARLRQSGLTAGAPDGDDARIRSAQAVAPCGHDDADDEGVRAQSSFAYIKISDGCDRWCSYCTIPLIRGRYHSFPLDRVMADARRAVDEGAKEIVLIGQDTGLWGTDFDEPSSLAALLDALAQTFPDTWVRALYTQPEHVTADLLRTMSRHENICPYLDMPLQHVDPAILKAMNRTGSKEEFLRLVRQAREAVPGIALRTTLIAGFPGETESMFDDLIDFVEEAAFDYVGVFPYSREEGTRAYDLPDQLDESEKAYRAERLRTVADAVSTGVIAARVGASYPVLVEGCEEDGQAYGRTVVQAPEVDGVTYVDAGEPGDVFVAAIEDTLMYDMEGTRA